MNQFRPTICRRERRNWVPKRIPKVMLLTETSTKKRTMEAKAEAKAKVMKQAKEAEAEAQAKAVSIAGLSLKRHHLGLSLKRHHPVPHPPMVVHQ
jgi:hypothetical protein